MSAAALALALALALAGPTSPSPPASAPELHLRRFEHGDRACEEACVRIRATWLELAGAEHAALNAELKRLACSSDSPEEPAADLAQRARSLEEDHRTLLRDFPDAPRVPWHDERLTTLLLSTPELLSVRVDAESYTGGAHPLASVTLATYELPSGRPLSLPELVATDQAEAFRAAAERSFRRTRGLEPKASLEAAGFWFEGDRFRLPTNWAVTADGLLLRFEAYDVGPWSMGASEFVLTPEQLRGLLRPGTAAARLLRAPAR